MTGPLVSLILAFLFYEAPFVAGVDRFSMFKYLAISTWPGAFNLMPGYPLTGAGLRAVLWSFNRISTNPRDRGERGKGLRLLLIFLGVLLMFGGNLSGGFGSRSSLFLDSAASSQARLKCPGPAGGHMFHRP